MKGLYQNEPTAEVSRNGTKTCAGQSAEFTGISSLYEAPEKPEITVDTGTDELETCVQQVIGEMPLRGIIKSAT